MKKLLIPLVLFSCTTPQAPSVERSSIFSGDPVTDDSLDAVVALTDQFGSPFCTGTYIGNRTVLSAGHCVIFNGAQTDPDFIYFGNAAAADADDCIGGDDNACLRFVPLAQNQGVTTFGFNDQNGLVNDISVIRLAEDPFINGQPVLPIGFASTFDGTQLVQGDEGDPVSFAGFGRTNEAQDPNNFNGIKFAVNQDFLSPLILNALGPDNGIGIDGNQVFYNQPVNLGGPCNGDSGGPMFVRRGNDIVVAAVTSFGDANCTDFGVSTRTDTFSEEICSIAGASALGCGGAPANEICNNGIDDDNDGDVDCDDANCANNAVCDLPEDCNNGDDDDNDGDVDCDDNDCAADVFCQAPAEVCDNGDDDDNDGALDCNDQDCFEDAACADDAAGRCAATPEAPVSGVAAFFLLGMGLVALRRRAARK